MCTCCSKRPGMGSGSLQLTEVTDCCELPCRCWELNESPLGVASALNSEWFFQPRFLVLTFKNNFLSFISTKVTQEGKKCLGLFYCLFSKRVDNSLGIF
ncbi:hypothetical protein ACRRTK_002323 [Alexandromys fortis]